MKLYLVTFVLLSVFLLYGCENYKDATLSKLFIIYRHGDRAPLSLYRNDPNPASWWPDGFGALTNIGKSQHYKLGEILRARYDYFLTDSINRTEVRSSNVNRCLESAATNMAALYPPNGKHVWKKGFIWQPVPIHTRPEGIDGMLNYNASCPEYDKEYERILQSPKVEQFNIKHQDLYSYLTNHSGQEVKSFSDVATIYDTLLIEKTHGLIIPEWALPVWKEMKENIDFNFYISSSTVLSRRLKGGVLLGDIISKMIANSKSTTPRVYIYSTHDNVLSQILSAIGVYNGLFPPYCSTLVVELHKKDQSESVQIYFRNSTNFGLQTEEAVFRKDPSEDFYPLRVPGCQQNCAMKQFIRLTKDSVPINWSKECGFKENLLSPLVVTIVGTLGACLGMSVVLIGGLLWLKCRCPSRIKDAGSYKKLSVNNNASEGSA